MSSLLFLLSFHLGFGFYKLSIDQGCYSVSTVIENKFIHENLKFYVKTLIFNFAI